MSLHEDQATTNDEIKYVASPTASRFHRDGKSSIRVMLGPVGGGKTVACLMEILARAMAQAPYRGVRQSRWAIVRDTYPSLKNTTLKTWQAWIPDRLCHVNMSPPFSGVIKQNLADGTRVECEVIFLALDEAADVGKLKSIEFTGIFINEVRYCDEIIFLTCKERLSRYPAMKPDEGFMGPSWYGIIADTNAWATTHWLYDMFDKGSVPEGHKLYEQPPAIYWKPEEKSEDKTVIAAHWEVNPDAENLRYLKADYYSRQLIGGKDDLLRVELGLERGISRMGKPVYPQFSEKHHVAKDKLEPRRGLPILLGFDWGLSPAMVVMQFLPGGLLNVLDALSPTDESFEEFLDNYVAPLINKRYAGYKIQAVGDPAGRGRSGLDKRTPYIMLNERGLHCKPAITNSFIPRKEAVDWFLDRHKMLVSPEITVVREGFAGGYFYSEMQGNAHKGMFKEQPVKNNYSHCFVGETLVSTPKGQKHIDSLEIGDFVNTPNGPCEILATMNRVVHELVRVDFSDGSHVICTPDHPFVTAGGLVRADTLQYTDVLINRQHPIKVVGVSLLEGQKQKVYDLTVDDAHCFYANNILVHNCMDAIQYCCLFVKYSSSGTVAPSTAPTKKFKYA